ncbi:MAG: FG-GAP repeat protein [Acidobacteriia bacterium]|nr:FG-GAP repeat protein [Terriglobia bacterium]
MNRKILLVGLACLSAVAVAQSDGSQQKSATPSSQQVTSPRDVATGQASGKRMHKPVTVTSDDQALRESPSKASLGKTSGRVAAGDVNGDGKADVAPAASSDVKSPRDLATGQASGKSAQPPAGGNEKSASDKSHTQPNK